jgi:hypothetical protein
MKLTLDALCGMNPEVVWLECTESSDNNLIMDSTSDADTVWLNEVKTPSACYQSK